MVQSLPAGGQNRSALLKMAEVEKNRPGYPICYDRGLDRIAKIAQRKYCRAQARPFRLGFPREVPVFPIRPPAAPAAGSSIRPSQRLKARPHAPNRFALARKRFIAHF
jgi:hypothetical protein